MNSANNRQVLASLLDQAYMEVFPTKTILDRLIHIPRHSYVAITCSPVKGLEPTLELVEKLRALPEERQLKLIPHIAARMVRDKGAEGSLMQIRSPGQQSRRGPRLTLGPLAEPQQASGRA